MVFQDTNTNALVSLAFGWLFLGLPSVLDAQTQEVQEGPLRGPIITVDDIRTSRKILNTCLDTREFQANMNLKEVLGRAYDELAKSGIEFPVLVDTNAFKLENLEKDVFDLPIKIAPLPERITVSQFLRELLDQIPGKCATILLRRGIYFELTTHKAFANEVRGDESALAFLERLWNGNSPGPSGISLSELEGCSIRPWQVLIIAGVLCGSIAAIFWWIRSRRRATRKRS